MKKEVVLVALLLIALLAFLSFSRLFNSHSEEDARKFFAEDLAQSYPTADVREITDVTKIGEGPGSYFALKARVSYNLSTPCPSRIEVEYDYPSQNFVRRTDAIVSACQVCLNRPHCVLSYEEEAIIASHTYGGSEPVKNYLQQYPHAKPAALLLDELNGERNVWQVDWNSPGAPGIRALIGQADTQLRSTQSLPVSPAENSAAS